MKLIRKTQRASIALSKTMLMVCGLLSLLLLNLSPAYAQEIEIRDTDFPLTLLPEDTYIGDYCLASGGISLEPAPGTGTFSVDVPGTPVAAHIYWSGRDKGDSADGDDEIDVSRTGGPADITVTAKISHTATAEGRTPRHEWYTYRSTIDLTGGNALIQEGQNELSISDFGLAERHGVGVTVVYEDAVNCSNQIVNLLFGDDFVYGETYESEKSDTAVTCVDFAAETIPRELNFQMFVGGVENAERLDAIWYQTGSGAKPATLFDNGVATGLDEALAGLAGVEFDNYDTLGPDTPPITIAPGDTWACFQVESPDRTDSSQALGISATWINLAVRIFVPDEPSCVDEGNCIDIEKFTNGIDADDPNDPNLPLLTIGDPVTWTYIVTNIGDVSYAFDDVDVSDSDLSVNPTFDSVKTGNDDNILDPGEEWLYIATGTVPDPGAPDSPHTFVDGCDDTDTDETEVRDTYKNIGRVTVPDGADEDPSHLCPRKPKIKIKKLTNGADANDPNGPDVPELLVGSVVTWTYIVTNTGETDFTKAEVVVTDDDPTVTPAYASVKTGNADGVLNPGEEWLYEASGIVPDPDEPDSSHTFVDGCEKVAIHGPQRSTYANIGTVDVPGAADSDPSHLCPIKADLAAERVDEVRWRYTIRNPGAIALENVRVFAANGIKVNCPQTTLAVGESIPCTATSPVVSASYAFGSIAWVIGDPVGGGASVMQWLLPDGSAQLNVAVTVNGAAADHPGGPTVKSGDAVDMIYTLTNNGTVALQLETTSDFSCTENTLTAGASTTCQPQLIIGNGPNVHIANISAKTATGETITVPTQAYFVVTE